MGSVSLRLRHASLAYGLLNVQVMVYFRFGFLFAIVLFTSSFSFAALKIEIPRTELNCTHLIAGIDGYAATRDTFIFDVERLFKEGGIDASLKIPYDAIPGFPALIHAIPTLAFTPGYSGQVDENSKGGWILLGKTLDAQAPVDASFEMQRQVVDDLHITSASEILDPSSYTIKIKGGIYWRQRRS